MFPRSLQNQGPPLDQTGTSEGVRVGMKSLQLENKFI